MKSRVYCSMIVLAAAGLLGACGARTRYPDPLPGRHNADYTLIFGRLLRQPAAQPDQPPLWTIRYGANDEDKYGGRFNLTPPAMLAGYTGGELVQITGSIHPEYHHPEYPGTWYQVDSIRLWPGMPEK